MKKSTLLTIASIIVIGVSAHIAKSENDATNPNPSDAATAALEERLNTLELKLQILESKNEILRIHLSEIQAVAVTPKEGWSRKVFNGETYYTIPASGRQN